MARRGRKRTAMAMAANPPRKNEKVAASEFEERQRAFNNQEVERRMAAIQAIQAAEVESLLSRLRLLRSYFSKEQLQTNVLQLFQENLPNLSLITNEKYKVFELKWTHTDRDGGNMQTSVGGGIPLSVRSVQSNFVDIAELQIPDFVVDDTSGNQMLGMREAFQTSPETGTKLPFDMTLKTLRLPKKGEMIMSVRGSPLGVYKEENLEAIHESGDGSHDGAYE